MSKLNFEELLEDYCIACVVHGRRKELESLSSGAAIRKLNAMSSTPLVGQKMDRTQTEEALNKFLGPQPRGYHRIHIYSDCEICGVLVPPGSYSRSDLLDFILAASSSLTGAKGSAANGTQSAYSNAHYIRPSTEKELQDRMQKLCGPYCSVLRAVSSHGFDVILHNVNNKIKYITVDAAYQIFDGASSDAEAEKALLNYFWGITQNEVGAAPVQECAHNWKLYHGFVDSYYYCELCDEKKPYTPESL